MPRPSFDAVSRGAGPAAADDAPEPPPRRWTRAEVEALQRREPPLSPWRVVAAQVGVGVVAGLLAWLVSGRAAALSALYGAGVVFVPGALVARAATSRLAAASPALSVASLLGWGFMKIALSFVLLATAQRLLPGLVWPVMLATLFVALQTYWFALLVRGRAA